jgi:sec-independent protein translocase protein TatB
MSFSETIFLFLLALIIFGPKKLPEIARQVGRYLNEFKRASNEFKAQIEQEISHLEDEKTTISSPSSPPEGAMSRSSSVTIESGSEAPATLATSADSATTSEGASEARPTQPESQPAAKEDLSADAVATSTSQESHA